MNLKYTVKINDFGRSKEIAVRGHLKGVVCDREVFGYAPPEGVKTKIVMLKRKIRKWVNKDIEEGHLFLPTKKEAEEIENRIQANQKKIVEENKRSFTSFFYHPYSPPNGNYSFSWGYSVFVALLKGGGAYWFGKGRGLTPDGHIPSDRWEFCPNSMKNNILLSDESLRKEGFEKVLNGEVLDLFDKLDLSPDFKDEVKALVVRAVEEIQQGGRSD